MENSINIINSFGVKFKVKIVKNGEKPYSKSGRLIHKGRTLVEFYDYNDLNPDGNIQFVSSYYVSTLLSNPNGVDGGLCLDTGSSTWNLSKSNLEEVLIFIKEFDVLEIKLAGTDSYGRMVYKSKTGTFYKDAKSANFPDSFFTTDSFEGEPDCPVLKSKFKVVA